MRFKYETDIRVDVSLKELIPTVGIAHRVHYPLIVPVKLGNYLIKYASVYKYKNVEEKQCVLREHYDKLGVSYPLDYVMYKFPFLVVDITNPVMEK